MLAYADCKGLAGGWEYEFSELQWYMLYENEPTEVKVMQTLR